MDVTLFDSQAGVYRFLASGLQTGFHAHPALEIIVARQGSFLIAPASGIYRPAKAAVIKSNAKHALDLGQSQCEIMLLDSLPETDAFLLARLGVTDAGEALICLPDGKGLSRALDELVSGASAGYQTRDDRILKSLHYIRANGGNARLSLSQVADQVHLSPSRVTHLFKEKVGASLQQYIVWTRLTYAMDQFMHQPMNLTEAALAAGFYDSAHFSKHFKALLGLKPSLPYPPKNSRIVQAR
jgi:AraC-like DNA-binding protein